MSAAVRARHYLLNLGYSPERVEVLMDFPVFWGQQVKREDAKPVRAKRGATIKFKKPPVLKEREVRLKEAAYAVIGGTSIEAAAKKHKVQTFEVVAAVHNARLEIKRLASLSR